ncbi:MAG: C4-type zinc ribbon domain-containing protein [Nitrospirales bacterium]|nr:hypothetical protein [Nitrospira sp.]MDR4500277.1 C4-type zinc ribbon domain-containing protein [Nitrospirales bacterium]
MNSQLQFLIELQQYDLRIFEILDQKKKHPDRIKAAERPLLEVHQRLKSLKETGEVLSKQRRDGEHELSLQEEHLQKLRGRLNDLKTNKEYQAHLFEIELARKKKDSLEEILLGVLEQAEQNDNEQKEVETQAREVEQAFGQAKQTLDSTLTSLDQELSTLEREHKSLTEQVDRGLLSRYMKLKTLRKGFAIAKVKDGTCSGCRLQLPPQLVAEVKRADELLNCSYCHRILYWEPSADATVETQPPVAPSV